MLTAIWSRTDPWIQRLSMRPGRLIGLALLRIFLGIAGCIFYLSDYETRRYLWGPDAYMTVETSREAAHPAAYSLYFWSESPAWFEFIFHAGILTAVLFTVFGGRWLTGIHAVFLWSIYVRNEEVLEGGDNLARILLPLMVLTVTDAYLAPGADRRRTKIMAKIGRARPSVLVHNFVVTALLVQIAVLYLVAGYWKATAEIWTNGTAIYYISSLHQFSATSVFGEMMQNAYLSWAVGYATIIIEVAVPFAIWTKRALLRKGTVALLEGMHAGIIVFMGLVPFGLIMIGADSLVLNDHDYQRMWRRLRSAFRNLRKAESAIPATAPAPLTGISAMDADRY